MNIMNLLKQKKDPSDVFTPRQSEVNDNMYIHRNKNEKSIVRWLKENMHGFIYGESGNGKTWLYKKVFNENNVNYVIANCTLASSKGSLRNEIFSSCMPSATSIKTGYSETKEAGLDAVVASATINHEANYEILTEDKLLISFKELSKKADKNTFSVIVLDNVETIFNNATLMDELADIIILLDDSRYAKYKVKFLIVGVPCGVIEYFSKSKNRSSVGNRITELPSVTGFSILETKEIVNKGFNEHLDCDLSQTLIDGITGKIYDITLGVPQRVHEYCLSLYYAREDNNGNIDAKTLTDADAGWLQKGLRESYAAIEQHFSGSGGQIRRGQVLYSIGKLKGHQFNTAEIGAQIRKNFTSVEISADSGIGSILSSLTKGDSPLLSKNTTTGSYSVIDPRTIMCLRLILEKTDDNQVIKRGFIRN
ncbi:hypothetical protein GCM10011613_16150 [Cellvibrio zantedeschiae]|uniref:ORC1/DEAH AAA+ ATPase domain-containing protein n=1 Tax=Cellvibrio zantedeschiae TaxID=1237077 RepID=A0ABQ3AZX0_9GAMM|nr:ATP-binding protein [Cellvibrio zantedeschiae]GGY72000.1 hypothetical protein GCM10011613_16150 [Cellvibrio zantedeschiae]